MKRHPMIDGRYKKSKTASRGEEEYPHASSTERATGQQGRSVRLGRKYYDGIDLAVSLEVLLAESPKRGKADSLTRGKKNPTSADWTRKNSRKKVGHQNIKLRFR